MILFKSRRSQVRRLQDGGPIAFYAGHDLPKPILREDKPELLLKQYGKKATSETSTKSPKLPEGLDKELLQSDNNTLVKRYNDIQSRLGQLITTNPDNFYDLLEYRELDAEARSLATDVKNAKVEFDTYNKDRENLQKLDNLAYISNDGHVFVKGYNPDGTPITENGGIKKISYEEAEQYKLKFKDNPALAATQFLTVKEILNLRSSSLNVNDFKRIFGESYDSFASSANAYNSLLDINKAVKEFLSGSGSDSYGRAFIADGTKIADDFKEKNKEQVAANVKTLYNDFFHSKEGTVFRARYLNQSALKTDKGEAIMTSVGALKEFAKVLLDHAKFTTSQKETILQALTEETAPGIDIGGPPKELNEVQRLVAALTAQDKKIINPVDVINFENPSQVLQLDQFQIGDKGDGKNMILPEHLEKIMNLTNNAGDAAANYFALSEFVQTITPGTVGGNVNILNAADVNINGIDANNLTSTSTPEKKATELIAVNKEDLANATIIVKPTLNGKPIEYADFENYLKDKLGKNATPEAIELKKQEIIDKHKTFTKEITSLLNKIAALPEDLPKDHPKLKKYISEIEAKKAEYEEYNKNNSLPNLSLKQYISFRAQIPVKGNVQDVKLPNGETGKMFKTENWQVKTKTGVKQLIVPQTIENPSNTVYTFGADGAQTTKKLAEITDYTGSGEKEFWFRNSAPQYVTVTVGFSETLLSDAFYPKYILKLLMHHQNK